MVFIKPPQSGMHAFAPRCLTPVLSASLKLPALPQALPARSPLDLDLPVAEASRYGTSVRLATMAVTPLTTSNSSAAPKAKKAQKTRGRKKRAGPSSANAEVKASVTAAQAAQNQASTRSDLNAVWVPDGHGGRRRVHLSKFRTLMLDSSYRPVSVIDWQKAMVLEWMQKVDVLEYYSGISIASASHVFPLPAVMRCRMYVQKPRRHSRLHVSKRNIMLRDRHTCQYCGSHKELTVDHVLPVSKGGTLSWGNCVTACRSCNAKKGSKTLQQLGWTTLRPPREPQPYELAPLRLVPKVAVELESADEHPWDVYVQPFLKSYSAFAAGAAARP